MAEPKAKEPCIFCRIIAKEIPCYEVYEDNKCLAFLDINPVNPGHLLVIPKAHYKTINDLPKKLCEHIAGVVWDLSLKVQQELDPDGIKIVQSNNPQAGQIVPHYHVHVIPRYKGDNNNYVEEWRTRKIGKKQMKDMQKKISSH